MALLQDFSFFCLKLLILLIFLKTILYILLISLNSNMSIKVCLKCYIMFSLILQNFIYRGILLVHYFAFNLKFILKSLFISFPRYNITFNSILFVTLIPSICNFQAAGFFVYRGPLFAAFKEETNEFLLSYSKVPFVYLSSYKTRTYHRCFLRIHRCTLRENNYCPMCESQVTFDNIKMPSPVILNRPLLFFNS